MYTTITTRGLAFVFSVGLAMSASMALAAVAQAATFYTGSDDRAIFDTNPNPGVVYGFAIDNPGGFSVGDTVTTLTASKLFNSMGNQPMTATLVFYDATTSPTIAQVCTSDTITPDFSAGYAASSSVAFTFSTPCVVSANAVVIGQIEAQAGYLYYDYHTNSYAAAGNPVGLAGSVAGIPAVPPGPRSKDDCKNGGWRTFSDPSFKNQGQCVSAVVSNRPASAR